MPHAARFRSGGVVEEFPYAADATVETDAFAAANHRHCGHGEASLGNTTPYPARRTVARTPSSTYFTSPSLCGRGSVSWLWAIKSAPSSRGRTDWFDDRYRAYSISDNTRNIADDCATRAPLNVLASPRLPVAGGRVTPDDLLEARAQETEFHPAFLRVLPFELGLTGGLRATRTHRHARGIRRRRRGNGGLRRLRGGGNAGRKQSAGKRRCDRSPLKLLHVDHFVLFLLRYGWSDASLLLQSFQQLHRHKPQRSKIGVRCARLTRRVRFD